LTLARGQHLYVGATLNKDWRIAFLFDGRVGCIQNAQVPKRTRRKTVKLPVDESLEHTGSFEKTFSWEAGRAQGIGLGGGRRIAARLQRPALARRR
jgi:hypothetical protein